MSPESYIKLRNLTVREGEPVQQILQRNLDQLHGLKEKAIVHLRVKGGPTLAGEAVSAYSIALTPSGARLETQAFTKPTLAVILPYDAFTGIANGSYSPLQAYLDGKLKVVGNVEIGKKIISHLSASGSAAGVCPTLYGESWHLDGPGYGHITFSGEFFSHFGTVEIVYDWGGGFYQQIVMADQNGAFTTTENNLSCGDIPGHPGVGVIVTATDIGTGQYVTKGYGTPC